MRIGAAWKRESKAGKRYISGVIEYPGMKLEIALFPKDEKRNESSPDFDIVWSERKKSDENTGGGDEFQDSVPF
jgi:uncharacterized protein (DUF736 family)